MRLSSDSRAARALSALAALALLIGPAALPAQVRSVDPNSAIDSDLVPLNQQPQQQAPTPASPAIESAPPAPADAGANRDAAAAQSAGYKKDDVIGAAEGVFGKGAEGLAGLIEKILKDQGQPNAYIAGREAGGALVVGLRYGSGKLFHKVEGVRDVYWTGPSIGFDFGANASKSFVLVYNLYDGQDLFHRFPAAEGTAYLVGGFTASYMRRGDVVLIPIRLGVGWRLGVNAGYMNFTEKSKWLPF
jgi:hypothetical protein